MPPEALVADHIQNHAKVYVRASVADSRARSAARADGAAGGGGAAAEAKAATLQRSFSITSMLSQGLSDLQLHRDLSVGPRPVLVLGELP